MAFIISVWHFALIYIPIWLDLLFYSFEKSFIFLPHLHSNMVRFIMLYLKYDEMNKL